MGMHLLKSRSKEGRQCGVDLNKRIRLSLFGSFRREPGKGLTQSFWRAGWFCDMGFSTRIVLPVQNRRGHEQVFPLFSGRDWRSFTSDLVC